MPISLPLTGNRRRKRLFGETRRIRRPDRPFEKPSRLFDAILADGECNYSSRMSEKGEKFGRIRKRENADSDFGKKPPHLCAAEFMGVCAIFSAVPSAFCVFWDYSDKYRAISSRNIFPYRCALTCPTPETSRNSSIVRGLRAAISERVALEKIT